MSRERGPELRLGPEGTSETLRDIQGPNDYSRELP
jgi:hypothetical protein